MNNNLDLSLFDELTACRIRHSTDSIAHTLHMIELCEKHHYHAVMEKYKRNLEDQIREHEELLRSCQEGCHPGERLAASPRPDREGDSVLATPQSQEEG
jgi:hypothetical protein